jgi:hypothetical protein
MLLLSLSNVWLNYFLSTEWPQYDYLIGVGIVLQVGAMILFHDAVLQLPAAMVITGLWLNFAGIIIYFWRLRHV